MSSSTVTERRRSRRRRTRRGRNGLNYKCLPSQRRRQYARPVVSNHVHPWPSSILRFKPLGKLSIAIIVPLAVATYQAAQVGTRNDGLHGATGSSATGRSGARRRGRSARRAATIA